MNKRAITLALLFLLVAIQWPLWFGKGGWLRVRELDKDLREQQTLNEELRLRNQKLRSEVSSLRDGLDAIQERARYELGMVGSDEIYVQVVSPNLEAMTAPPTPLSAGTVSASGNPAPAASGGAASATGGAAAAKPRPTTGSVQRTAP